MSDPEVPAHIQELRAAMNRVRLAQEAAGMVVDMARYDAETDVINQEFLLDFTRILPIRPEYSGNSKSDTFVDMFSMVDPADMRATTSFGILLMTGRYTPEPRLSFIIGEKVRDDTSTNVLVQGYRRQVQSDGQWSQTAPILNIITVKTAQWQALRDKAINSLGEPHDAESLMSTFSSEKQAFVLSQKNSLHITTAQQVNRDGFSTQRQIARMYKYYNRPEEHTLGCELLESRSLRSSDFADYNVMTYMEYIAAAFRVGEAFDEVKTAREQKMPKHPAEATFGLPNYRQITEQPGLFR